MDLFCLEGHDEVNITIEIKPDNTPEVAEVFTVNLVNVSDLDRLQIGAVSKVIFWLVLPHLLASYADILWARAIFLPHKCLLIRPRERSLPFVCLCPAVSPIVQRETSNIREMSSQVKARERSLTNVCRLCPLEVRLEMT